MHERTENLITLDIAVFRAQFRAFANPVEYPDGLLQMNFDAATSYISDDNYGLIAGKTRQLALYQMTAHLIQLNNLIADSGGEAIGITTNASVDKVRVSIVPPPFGNDQWAYWMNLTPYGAALLALLELQSVGGFYIGGEGELSGFRRVRGQFLPHG